MSRPASLLPARAGATLLLTALLGLATVLAGPTAPGHAAPVESEQALALTIDALSPSYVPRRGPVRITGTVTNTTDETWYAVNVLPFVGTAPIQSTEALRSAVDSDPVLEVGQRVSEVGQFAAIGNLEPGETADFDIRLARRHLTMPDEPGAYWFGVHASGETETIPRDLVADGRARTFLAQLPKDSGTADVGLVVPLRHEVTHTPSGRLGGIDQWREDLAPGGSLDTVLEFGETSEAAYTWLVDPAVLDAVARIADGNRARDLGPTELTDPGEDDGEPSATQAPAAAPAGSDDVTPSDRELARQWLERATAVLADADVWVLPFGDLDVAAALRHAPGLHDAAVRRSRARMKRLGLSGRSAVAPADGFLSRAAIARLATGTRVLLDQATLPEVSVRTDVENHDVWVDTPEITEGGPGPSDPLAPVAMRQRLLAEAAVAIVEERPGMVVELSPEHLAPGDADALAGLDVPWLRLGTLDSLTGGEQPAGTATPPEPVRPGEAVEHELPEDSFTAARELIRIGQVLDDVLPMTDDVARQVQQQALSQVSQWRRTTAATARLDTLAARDDVQRMLDRITVTGQPVTLSSERGRFSVTVVNGLEQPIQVQVRATTDSPLEITDPEPLTLRGSARATQVLDARSSKLGLHSVELTLTDSRDRPLGSTAEMTVRASQVSQLIWVVIALGLGLMGIAIVRRLVNRVVQWRRSREAA